MGPGPILETKLTLDGRAQTFACAGLLLSPRLALIRFDHPAERRTGGFFFPAGSFTLGFFWRARSYNCYRITGPDGAVIVYRFDVVDRVRVGAGRVSYRDLLLDILVSPNGRLVVEDEDEVTAASVAGLLTPAQQQTIDDTRALLERAHPRIIAEVERIVATL